MVYTPSFRTYGVYPFPLFSQGMVYTIASFALWPRSRATDGERMGATVMVYTLSSLAREVWHQKPTLIQKSSWQSCLQHNHIGSTYNGYQSFLSDDGSWRNLPEIFWAWHRDLCVIWNLETLASLWNLWKQGLHRKDNTFLGLRVGNSRGIAVNKMEQRGKKTRKAWKDGKKQRKQKKRERKRPCSRITWPLLRNPEGQTQGMDILCGLLRFAAEVCTFLRFVACFHTQESLWFQWEAAFGAQSVPLGLSSCKSLVDGVVLMALYFSTTQKWGRCQSAMFHDCRQVTTLLSLHRDTRIRPDSVKAANGDIRMVVQVLQGHHFPYPLCYPHLFSLPLTHLAQTCHELSFTPQFNPSLAGAWASPATIWTSPFTYKPVLCMESSTLPHGWFCKHPSKRTLSGSWKKAHSRRISAIPSDAITPTSGRIATRWQERSLQLDFSGMLFWFWSFNANMC